LTAVAVLGLLGALIFDLVMWSAYFSVTLNRTVPLPPGMAQTATVTTVVTRMLAYYLIAVFLAAVGTAVAAAVGLLLVRIFRGAVVPAFIAVAMGPFAVLVFELGLHVYMSIETRPPVRFGEILGWNGFQLLGSVLVFLVPPLLALPVLLRSSRRASARLALSGESGTVGIQAPPV
jgi:hypothetical protein